ncbi:MAG: hypothetical protein NDP13_06585 [Crenarchaeota archaeon]|nr:hypothetical protein [Thermoproteota archaeon]
MKSLKTMEVGYNIVEKSLVGKEFENIEEKISIIEFLRRLYRKQPVNRKIAVIGLEEALLAGEETARYIRRILVDSTYMLRTNIIQFQINGELILDKEPKIRYRSKEINLIPIFGNRIKPKTVGYFHSPPNI